MRYDKTCLVFDEFYVKLATKIGIYDFKEKFFILFLVKNYIVPGICEKYFLLYIKIHLYVIPNRSYMKKKRHMHWEKIENPLGLYISDNPNYK